MSWWLAPVFVLGFLLWDTIAVGQTVNPPAGSVWTYQGPSYGAMWMPALPPPVTTSGNLTGAQTGDNFILDVMTQANPSANQIWQWIICTAACGAFTVDAIRGVGVAINHSTGIMTSVSGYMVNDNDNTASGLAQAVVSGAYGIGAVNGAQTWGFNSLLSDNEYLVASAGTGRMLYNELDFNITSPNTGGGGLMLGPGTWLVQPNGVNAIAINTPWGTSLNGPSTPFAKWSIGLIMQSGCCQDGIVFGTATYTATSSDPSQILVMTYRDNTSTAQQLTLQAAWNGAGKLFIGGTRGAGIEVPAGGGPNGLALDQTNPLSFGANNPSQYIVFSYSDSSNALQNYGVRADNTGTMSFTGTAPTPKYLFNGQLTATAYMSNGQAGTSCSGTPTSGFATTGGIVTHC